MINQAKTFNQKYPYFLLSLIVLLSVPFAIYAFNLAKDGFTFGLANIETQHIPLNKGGSIISNHGLSIHLLLGALLTILIPVQVILGWSRKAMSFHKWSGYVVIISALVTGIGGLLYIIFNGTIGGTVMNIAFGLYGSLVILTAWKSAEYARSKQFKIHEEWSMRLFVLGVGSWLYRLGYGMIFKVYPNMDVFGPRVSFQSPIDYFMDFAFYLPPLIGLELYFRYGKQKWHPLIVSSILILITAFFIYGFLGFFG